MTITSSSGHTVNHRNLSIINHRNLSIMIIFKIYITIISIIVIGIGVIDTINLIKNEKDNNKMEQ